MKEVTILLIYDQVCKMSETDFKNFTNCIEREWGDNVHVMNFVKIAKKKRSEKSKIAQ